jgi:acyl carrier protein
MPDIEARIIEIAAKHGGVEPSQVTPAHHFINDLNYDSLTLVEMTMELEDAFGITIPDEAAQKIHTVGEAIEAVKQHPAGDKVAPMTPQALGSIHPPSFQNPRGTD